MPLTQASSRLHKYVNREDLMLLTLAALGADPQDFMTAYQCSPPELYPSKCHFEYLRKKISTGTHGRGQAWMQMAWLKAEAILSGFLN